MRGALLSLLSLWVFSGTAWADLAEVQQKGVLRHFGVETANFVRDDGTGLDVELLTRFAESIGVRYERVPVSAADAQAFLQGRRPLPGFGPGDALSGGLAPSILPAGLAASRPLFPVQFWLLARGDSPIRGETSRGRIEWDIRAAKAKMKGRTVYAINDGLSTPFAEALRAEGFRVEYAGWRASDLVEKLRKNPDPWRSWTGRARWSPSPGGAGRSSGWASSPPRPGPSSSSVRRTSGSVRPSTSSLRALDELGRAASPGLLSPRVQLLHALLPEGQRGLRALLAAARPGLLPQESLRPSPPEKERTRSPRASRAPTRGESAA
jgi:hypothetical protein